MTSQNDQNQAPAQSAKKEGAGSKLTGGLSWWLGSLMGKPRAAKVPVIPETPQAAPAQAAGTVTPEAASTQNPETIMGKLADDSVMQDVQSLKKIVGKFSGKVETAVTPLVKEGVSGATKSAVAFNQKVGPKFMTKILRIFFVILLLIVIAFVALKLFNRKSGGGGNATPTESVTNEQTPTPVYYNPPKASIYATDESILKLESDIDVITKELSSAVLKENDLNPPVLDYNVAF